MDKRELSYVRTHENLFTPGLGNLANVLQDTPTGQRGIKLYATDHGIDVEYRKVEFTIPWPNVVLAVYKSEK